VLNLLLQRLAFHEPLVAAIERERLKLGELNLDLEQRRRLLRESTPEIRARAGTFLGDESMVTAKRSWRPLRCFLSQVIQRGARGVREICSQCHAVEGVDTRSVRISPR
jgi:hypothetical protein